MFRLTSYMKSLLSEKTESSHRGRRSQAPVVIWNLLRRCNLACKHCYTNSTNRDYPGELTYEEILEVMRDLKQMGVSVLILSGGEPLLHPRIFEISQEAVKLGFYVGLSSNGTLMDEETVARIRQVGFQYVGISVDGIGEVHDQFRRQAGAFDRALNGVHRLHSHGIKVGLRYCLTQDTWQSLPLMLDLIEQEGIAKFYLSHLNYSGRGETNHKMDAFHQMTRDAMDLLFERCLELLEKGDEKEFVTGNNDADGVYFLHWAKRRFGEEKADRLRKLLVDWGGNATGVGVANIGPDGQVHPDSFWGDYDLGDVRKRPFSEIWNDLSEPLMAGLKKKPRLISGRCGKCHHFDICGGNTRVRAYQRAGDPWSEDPGCYLTPEEIGISQSGPYFPMFVSLREEEVLVIGGGEVATRKVEKLEPFGVRISVVAPKISERIFQSPSVKECFRRNFEMQDLEGKAVVIVAAPDREGLHETIYRECVRRKIPCNSVDHPKFCTFLFPALVVRGDVTVGVSTSGRAPALSAKLRKEIEKNLPHDLDERVESISQIREGYRKPHIDESEKRAIAQRAIEESLR